MKKKDESGVAFPSDQFNKGLSKREYFAGKIMAAMIGNDKYMNNLAESIKDLSTDEANSRGASDIAQGSVLFADALIKELAK